MKLSDLNLLSIRLRTTYVGLTYNKISVAKTNLEKDSFLICVPLGSPTNVVLLERLNCIFTPECNSIIP